MPSVSLESCFSRLVLFFACLYLFDVRINSGASRVTNYDKFKRNDNKVEWRRNYQRGPGAGFKYPGNTITRPNIVLIMTDDQDTELGSLNFMPKTMRLLAEEGAYFENGFVTTPMCCPSRSSMLTGMYVHNHNTYTNNDNCSSPEWRRTYETRNFGTYLTNAGYRTGYFGKYLNQYRGAYIPPGWTEWVALIRNSRFYNYSLNFNGKKIKHEDNYYRDYLPDLIANDSVTFLKQSKQYFPHRPVAMVLSLPAPHGPEDAAPQYQHLFENVSTHRTPSWNFAPNPDKQWILQHTGKMEPIHAAFTDMLQRKRLQTLQSVDDCVEKVYRELKMLGELDNTYILFTSDHGYHVGQYGLLKGKATPYEFDIRVPFMMRGPGIPPSVRMPNIALNIDIAPTLLDIAGVDTPPHMDGRSLLKLFEGIYKPRSISGNIAKPKKAWRDTFLVERGKITRRQLNDRERKEAEKNNLIITKEQRLESECLRAEYQPPCSPNQEWECLRGDDGKIRMFKCRSPRPAHPVSNNRTECRCVKMVGREEKRLQRQFLRENVNQPKKLKPIFIKKKLHKLGDRSARSKVNFKHSAARLRRHFKHNDIYFTDVKKALLRKRRRHRRRAFRQPMQDSVDELIHWKSEKRKLDDVIRQYRQKLERLKRLRKKFKASKHIADINESDLDSDLNTIISSKTNPTPTTAMNPQSTYPLVNHSSVTGLPLDGPTSAGFVVEQTDTDDTQSPLEFVIPYTTKKPDYLEYKLYSSGEMTLDHCVCPKGYKISPRFQQDSRPDIRKTNRPKKPLSLRVRHSRADRVRQSRAQVRLDHSAHSGNLKSNADCWKGNMKCFLHDNKHWRTPPLWKSRTVPTQVRQATSQHEHTNNAHLKPVFSATHSSRRHHFGLGVSAGHIRGARRDPACQSSGLECARMDNSHWRVNPKWTLGPFCFCPNASNNTYWCVRTINDTHNFLYCEFITGFISYYNIKEDPYQLRNAVLDLSYATLQLLHNTLEKLRACKGFRECTVRNRPTSGFRVNRNVQQDKKWKRGSFRSSRQR